jgi:D-aminoacyl-tRNA deacylase
MKAVVQRVSRARVLVRGAGAGTEVPGADVTGADVLGGDVTEADVTGAGVTQTHVAGEIGAGMVVFVCVLRGDGPEQARALAAKIAHFRFFADAQGRMNVSALERGLAALVVSQFTLAAAGDRGRRPSFDRAAPPEVAVELYELFVSELRTLGLEVRTGHFAAHMEVELSNDGPVTFVLESAPSESPPRMG